SLREVVRAFLPAKPPKWQARTPTHISSIAAATAAIAAALKIVLLEVALLEISAFALAALATLGRVAAITGCSIATGFRASLAALGLNPRPWLQSKLTLGNHRFTRF